MHEKIRLDQLERKAILYARWPGPLRCSRFWVSLLLDEGDRQMKRTRFSDEQITGDIARKVLSSSEFVSRDGFALLGSQAAGAWAEPLVKRSAKAFYPSWEKQWFGAEDSLPALKNSS